VTLVPCGLTYTHRHRFRSQALLHFGEPISVDGEWLSAYESSEETTVRAFTDNIADALAKVTLNAPDWETLRFVHAARRLYKPTSVSLTPGTYVELSRRFVEGYLATADSPEIQHLRGDVEDYQAHLDLLGLKDHHLRESVDALDAWNGVLWRSLAVAALLPLAIPGALFHLPIGWVAITAGERLSDGQDDVATLKVITSVLLLPVVYIAVGTMTGIGFGLWWGMAVTTVLPLSFLSLIKVVEVQANMTLATLTNLRLNRFSQEVAGLRATRRHLVDRIRTAVDTHADRSRSPVHNRPDRE
jgi:glycerol-3-phosphate O-acyltransferase/dihydroxyacetone phosphate acyltransferase